MFHLFNPSFLLYGVAVWVVVIVNVRLDVGVVDVVGVVVPVVVWELVRVVSLPRRVLPYTYHAMLRMCLQATMAMLRMFFELMKFCEPLWPANTMWRKLLYSGFETCFGPSTQGAGTKTHLKSRFCAILKKRGAMLEFEMDRPSCSQAFSSATFKCNAASPCAVQFDVKAAVGTHLWQGFANGFAGAHSWTMTYGPRDIKLNDFSDSYINAKDGYATGDWERVKFVYPDPQHHDDAHSWYHDENSDGKDKTYAHVSPSTVCFCLPT